MLNVNKFAKHWSMHTRKMQGFSILELMIAISLSLFLMLAVYKVFDVQQRAFEIIGALNDREDNAQLALSVLAENIRMADYWGGVDLQQVQHIKGGLSVFPGGCNASWIFKLSQGVFGLEGESLVESIQNLPGNCLRNTDYVANSDLLALRFGNSHEYFHENEIDNKRYQKHYFLRAQAGRSANLFQGKDLPLAIQAIPDKGFHYNMLFNSSLFFLRPCKQALHGCEEGNSVLTRLILKGDRYIQEALVEGIEQLQFEYGFDENSDNVVDRYVIANNVTDWQKVLSVRIFILVRGHLKDKSIDENGKQYVMSSTASKNSNIYSVPAQDRFYPRKLYQSEVVIRNRLLKAN